MNNREFLEAWHEACVIDESDGPLVRLLKTNMSLGVALPESDPGDEQTEETP